MGWVVNATPRPLYPRERPGTQCTGGGVGLTVGLDGCGKSRPPPGFDPRTVQPVPSSYTDWAIPARINSKFGKNPTTISSILYEVLNTFCIVDISTICTVVGRQSTSNSFLNYHANTEHICTVDTDNISTNIQR